MDRRETPGRRAEDKSRHHIRVRENWYRDVWLLIITGLTTWSVLTTMSTVNDVQEGRRAAVGVTCAATSAVIDAGRAAITGGAQGVSGEFARNLEALGYPPKHVRERQAKQAARAYSRAISHRVEKATGVAGIVKPNGTLDCERLAELSRVN